METNQKSRLNSHTIARIFSLVLIGNCYFTPQVALGDAFIASNTLSYEGVWQKFDTLNDAQGNTSSTDSGIISTRDLQFQFSDEPGNSLFAFVTGFNLTADDGTQNPSNMNEGFLQIYDLGATTVTEADYSFFNSDNSGFQIQITGENALRFSSNQYTRAGVGPDAAAPGNQGGGNWLNYDFDMTFSGLDSNLDGESAVTTEEAGDVSGSGFILFQFTDSDFPASLGFYRINLNIGDDSWAVANNPPSTFTNEIESDQGVVPEPRAFALISGIFAAFALLRRRRA